MDAAAAHCRNCGAATLGAYCHACGQSTRERVPTVREFVHEFIGHYVALEGPLWRTLALLLFRPGELTRHYLGGKRASYVLPLRLYLTFSVILVALTAWNGTELRLGSESLRFDEKSLTYNVARNHVRTGSESAFVRRLSELAALAPEERTKRLRSSVQATLPYVLVALVFLLALALKLAYWNRGMTYGEHLVAAFHLQTVLFIACLVSLAPLPSWAGSTVIALLVIHWALALRRIYAGRRIAVVLRALLLLWLYLVITVVAIASVAVIGVFIS